MDHSTAIFLIAIPCWLLASCASSESQTTRVSTSMIAETVPKTTAGNKKISMINVREWTFRDGREFRDRNGDGIVDWQATGANRYSDGFGIYKEDNDFDGYFDREYEAGGFAYKVNYDKNIHERVPQIHKIYPPTKTTRKPKPEQNAAEQPATRLQSKSKSKF